jgi:hypothetical protein
MLSNGQTLPGMGDAVTAWRVWVKVKFRLLMAQTLPYDMGRSEERKK